MNKKIHYSERLGFLDYAEVGKVYDIEVSRELVYRDVFCAPNEDDNCDGCLLAYSELSCGSIQNKHVCGNGKFIPLSDLLEDL